MKMCSRCINNPRCNQRNKGSYATSRKCKAYAWEGDGKTYEAHDGLRRRGKKKMTILELIEANRRRQQNV